MGNLQSVDRQHFVWALGTMCRLNRVPFDPERAFKQYPPPCTLDHLTGAARSYGLTAKLSRLNDAPLAAGGMPCIVALKPGPESPGDAAELGLVLRAEGDEVDLARPGEHGVLSKQAFGERFTGVSVRFSRSAEQAVRPEEHAEKGFGFHWFLPELLRHKLAWSEVLLASLAIQALGLAVPLLTQVVIDRVVSHQTVNTLIAIAIALALLLAFTGAMSWARQNLLLVVGNRIDAVLGNRVFEHLLALPARYFEPRPTGTLVARLRGVETIRDFLTGAAVAVLLDLPFLVLFLAAMLYYSVELTLLVLALLSLVVMLSLVVAPVMRSRLNRQFLLGARNQAFLTEYVSGIDTVKALQMEPQLRRRYAGYFSELLTAGYQARRLHAGYSVAVTSIEQGVAMAVLCLGAWEVMRNDGFTVGMLVAFQMFALRLAQPLTRLAGLWQEFQQAGIAVRRLGDLMDAPCEPSSAVPQRAASDATRIEVEGLRFRHSETGVELFGGLSFEIGAGECVAITGVSGCGKSTLARLLQGDYSPSEGRIRIGGHDLRTLPVNELRALLGVVPQETQLFSGTVYENLVLGNPEAGFEEIVQACRLAEMHEVVEALPAGYQTWLGEHGVGLSGGQKQRLAIARALLRKPRILLLDEATSQLDARASDAIFATVSRLKGRLTVIVIAHELPRSLRADRCIELGRETAHGRD